MSTEPSRPAAGPSGWGRRLRDVLLRLPQAGRVDAEVGRSTARDHLTGLLDRQGLAAASADLVARAAAGGHRVGVLLVNVDRLRAVNLDHGHLAADEVLRVIAHELGDVARAGDVVARVGGDEFCVVLVCSDSDDMAATGERLRATVEAAPTHPSTTASVGGACLTPTRSADGADFVMRLLARAAEPLHEVKWTGGNRVDIVVGP